jgi:hypothetical protein
MGRSGGKERWAGAVGMIRGDGAVGRSGGDEALLRDPCY